MTRDNTPILVTGAPRSGTTFLGRMLSLPPYIRYIDEPFNLQTGIKAIDQPFLYIPVGNNGTARKYDPVIKALLAGRANYRPSIRPDQDQSAAKRAGRLLLGSKTAIEYHKDALNPLKTRALLKDPMACFSAEYLHRRFGMNVVVIVRHPASTIASFKRLGWRYDLRDLTSQPQLMDRFLSKILPNPSASRLSDVQNWSYLWLAIYSVLDAYIAANPDMIVVRHIDLSKKPLPEFERLYDSLHLPFTESVREKIESHTTSDNPVSAPDHVAHALKRDSAAAVSSWKKILTPSEVDEIRRLTASVSDRYFTDIDW